MDVHSKSIRSKNMAAIKSKSTKPELRLRHALHNLGFRYRLHTKLSAGKPDLVLRKYNAVVFVHGCFWHKHRCNKFRWPKTRETFWKNKLTTNEKRDKRIVKSLRDNGWRVAIVWECALSGRNNPENRSAEVLGNWFKGNSSFIEIAERSDE